MTVTGDTTIVAWFVHIEDSVNIDRVLDSPSVSISLVPNPARGAVLVSVEGVDDKISVQVLDLLGREVRHEMVDCPSNCKKNIDIGSLSSGAYIVRITSRNLPPIIRRLIIR